MKPLKVVSPEAEALLNLRDIAIFALAANADPNDARAVIREALREMETDLRLAARHFEGIHGGYSEILHTSLRGIAGRCRALRELSEKFIVTDFHGLGDE